MACVWGGWANAIDSARDFCGCCVAAKSPAAAAYIYLSGTLRDKNQMTATRILVLKNPRHPAGKIWCQLSDLNQRPSDYKSDALPAELNWQRWVV